jgi:hypothetical protein
LRHWQEAGRNAHCFSDATCPHPTDRGCSILSSLPTAPAHGRTTAGCNFLRPLLGWDPASLCWARRSARGRRARLSAGFFPQFAPLTACRRVGGQPGTAKLLQVARGRRAGWLAGRTERGHVLGFGPAEGRAFCINTCTHQSTHSMGRLRGWLRQQSLARPAPASAQTLPLARLRSAASVRTYCARVTEHNLREAAHEKRTKTPYCHGMN